MSIAHRNYRTRDDLKQQMIAKGGNIVWVIMFLLMWSVSPLWAKLLDPISTEEPDQSQFPRATHPFVPTISVDTSKPVPTNKFWNNFFLSDIGSPVHVHPYVVTTLMQSPYGLAISHSFSPDEKGMDTSPARQEELTGRVEFYYNVISTDMGFTAVEFDTLPSREIVTHDTFGCQLRIGTIGQGITFPIIRGMAYVTAIYEGTTPIIYTNAAFTKVNNQTTGTISGTKFVIHNSLNQIWVLYVLTPNDLTFTISNNQLIASEPYHGILRIAKLPNDKQSDAEIIYDSHYDSYPTGGELSLKMGMLSKTKATYSFNWNKVGKSTLLHFTFPHHQDIISSKSGLTSLKLWSTTKGEMVAYIGNKWNLNEDDLTSIKWLPPRKPSKSDQIIKQLETDINSMDVTANTVKGENYFGGKGVAKIALLCLLADHFELPDLLDTCLSKVKEGISPYVNGENINSLRYDTTYKGVIGHGGLHCDNPDIFCPGVDFGNSYYNDHHYHWGYFVHAAAIIAHLDPTWIEPNKDWVETLIRDVANPSSIDKYFPVFRSFDWFSGHSWSQGLFASADGKDQESTSEEINFHYGLMLWGIATSNTNLKQMGNIMYAVSKRSIQRYFLMKSGNDIHPAEFVKNKVTGIFFENKVHYTTWFGYNPEFIHGIQMLPYLPVTEEVREYQFVKEEWDTILSKRIDKILPVDEAWKSILYLNYASIEPSISWNCKKLLLLKF
eukprot:TRINITY_DN993_c0_g1_i1.p1 TRINITY_DN993_c0_g1~~TRINITY_DN993_c0_g1_i1.p1  ORF type:complete len:722 (+),score=114.93 TRINITY_DN993_c0_g1_i1:404-2569(+)